MSTSESLERGPTPEPPVAAADLIGPDGVGPGGVGPDLAGAAMGVAGAARGLGVAPATLRSWERRYGLAPSAHTPGGHRRYNASDLARLRIMHRLVCEGVPPAEAARVAIRARIPASDRDGVADAGADARVDAAVAVGTAGTGVPRPTARGSSGGGRVLAIPGGARQARGLARAAMALDAHGCQEVLASSLADRGATATWDELVRPVLAGVGERWAASGRSVEVEHAFSAVVAATFAGHAARLNRARNDRPVLLASVPDELHDLPLVGLQAALADVGIRALVVGARTPEVALADAIGRVGPPVVFLWAHSPETAVLPSLQAVRPAPTILLGGPGWSEPGPDSRVLEDLAGAVRAIAGAMSL